MKKKILALAMLSLLATSCQGNENEPPQNTTTQFKFSYSFDATLGKVTSSHESGKMYDKGTSITLTASAFDGLSFGGFYNVSGSSLVSAEKVYTFTLEADTELTAKFYKIEINDADLGVVKGTFHSEKGNLTVTNQRAKLEGKDLNFDLELFTGKNDAANANGNVFYLGQNREYRLFLNDSDFKNVVLEKKVDDKYVEFDTFMPSISEFAGTYWQDDGYDFEYSAPVVTISNLFDNDRDLFVANFGIHSEYFTFDNQSARYFKSGFVEQNGEIVKAVELYDYADNANYGRFVLTTLNDKALLKNIDISNGYGNLVPQVGIFGSTYFSENGNIQFKTSADGKKVTCGEEVYDVTSTLGAEGYTYTLKSATKTRTFKSHPYGIIEVVDGKDVFFPFEGTEKFVIGTFAAKGMEVTFDGTKLTINGTERTFKFVNSHFHKSIEADVDGKKVIIHGYKDDSSDNFVIKVYEGEKTLFLVNKAKCSDIFTGKALYKGLTIKDTIEIDENFNLTYNNNKINVDLEYDPLHDSVYLLFSIEGTNYTYELYDEAIKCFVLKSETEERFFFNEDSLTVFTGDYTSHHKKELVFANDKATYNDEVCDYSFEPLYDKVAFANFVCATLTSSQGFSYTFISDLNGNVIEVKGEDAIGKPKVEKTFIKFKDFESMVGRYSFKTKLGEENFELKSTGVFTADEFREDKQALQEDVVKKYTLGYTTMEGASKPVPTIGFLHGNTIILVKKDGASLVAFGNYYVHDYIYAFNGFYKDATNTLSLYQNKLFLNGKEYKFDSWDKLLDGTKITSGTHVFNFKTTGETLTVEVTNGEEKFTLASSIFNPETLVGAKLVEGQTTYEVIKETDPNTGVTKVFLNDGFIKYEGKYVLHNGKEAYKFSVVKDEFYAFVSEGNAVLEKVSSVPPLPPGPPLPPPPLPPLPPAPPAPPAPPLP